MKLDESVIEYISQAVIQKMTQTGQLSISTFQQQLEKLDLVVKPGDSSQSLLVTND